MAEKPKTESNKTESGGGGDDWNPSKPLDDAGAEEEAQARARAHARFEYLKRSHLAKIKEEGGSGGTGKKNFKLWDE